MIHTERNFFNTEPHVDRMRRTTFLYLAVIWIVAIIGYHNIFHNQFVWDDKDFIVDWEVSHSFKNIPHILEGDTPYKHNGSYRPLTQVYYLVSYMIWRDNPVGYHINNLLLHMICASLVYLIAWHLFRREEVALLMGVLFATHPLLSEVVNFMTSTYNLAAVFLFLSFYLYLRWKESRRHLHIGLSLLFAFMAYFTYELTLIIPLLVIWYDAIMKRAKEYYAYAAFFSGTVLYFTTKSMLHIGTRGGIFGQNYYWASLASAKAFLKYVALTIFPFRLSVVHPLGDRISSLAKDNLLPAIRASVWLLSGCSSTPSSDIAIPTRLSALGSAGSSSVSSLS